MFLFICGVALLCLRLWAVDRVACATAPLTACVDALFVECVRLGCQAKPHKQGKHQRTHQKGTSKIAKAASIIHLCIWVSVQSNSMHHVALLVTFCC